MIRPINITGTRYINPGTGKIHTARTGYGVEDAANSTILGDGKGNPRAYSSREQARTAAIDIRNAKRQWLHVVSN